MTTLTKDDLEYLDLLAKTLSRQFAWSEEQGRTNTLRKPLRETIADLVGVDLAEETEGWKPFGQVPLGYRHQRLAFRGLVLYWYRDLFQGDSFRSDRYAFLSQQLALFGQELL